MKKLIAALALIASFALAQDPDPTPTPAPIVIPTPVVSTVLSPIQISLDASATAILKSTMFGALAAGGGTIPVIPDDQRMKQLNIIINDNGTSVIFVNYTQVQ